MRQSLITGLSGAVLTASEKSFLSAASPAGIILFARNCIDQMQIRRLVDDAKDAIGTGDVLVLIDQEGGRVMRLRPPVGRALPPAAAYASHFDEDSARAAKSASDVARLLADDLRALAINCNCAPVLDVPVPGAHDIIGDRAYDRDPGLVTALGRAVAEGLMAGAVLPVIKHIPGHGRATKDSHFELPVVTEPRTVLEATDFAPFRALAHLPAAMTAHVVYSALDQDGPASTSAIVTQTIIRGYIGFDGLLMSDDLSMKALSGSLGDRAQKVIAAGSDLALHCNGQMREMEAVAAHVPPLSGKAQSRFETALKVTESSRIKPFDAEGAERILAALRAGDTRPPESV